MWFSLGRSLRVIGEVQQSLWCSEPQLSPLGQLRLGGNHDRPRPIRSSDRMSFSALGYIEIRDADVMLRNPQQAPSSRDLRPGLTDTCKIRGDVLLLVNFVGRKDPELNNGRATFLGCLLPPSVCTIVIEEAILHMVQS